jgi:OmpA-OmpF porin, OOP family
MKKTAVATLLLTAFPAFAIQPDAGWYLGFGAGQSQMREAPEDKSTGGKAFLGYQFNRVLALEAGYVYLGRFEATKVKGPFVEAVGMIPLSDRFSLFGKIGGVRAWVTSGSAEVSDNKRVFGYGANWNFHRSLTSRLEWERFRELGDKDVTGESDVDFLSFSLIWKY